MTARSGLLVLASVCLAAPLPALAEAQPPQEQQQFCALVANYQQSQAQYTQEANPIRKAAMRPPNPLSYEQEVRTLFADHNQFRDWIGTVRFSVVGKSVALSFSPIAPEAPKVSSSATAPQVPPASRSVCRSKVSKRSFR